MIRTAYSTVGLRDRPLEAALHCIASAGFQEVELASSGPHLPEEPREVSVHDLRKTLDALGFRGVTVHGPMKRNILGACDDNWRKAAVATFDAYLHFTAAIGATSLTIHPVPSPDLVDPGDGNASERIRTAVLRSLDELVPVAERSGVRILLENLPYDCNYPFLDMAALRPLVDGYPEDALGLIIDTGHAGTRRLDPAREIQIAGARLGGTHLHDVDGINPNDDHWVPTHGSLDWHAIRRALREITYAGPWTFEIIRPRHGETPEELLAKTRAIAAEWETT